MPTVDLGPCECCGGGGQVDCCAAYVADSLPSSISVEFSEPVFAFSSPTQPEIDAIGEILSQASYDAVLLPSLPWYRHPYGTRCLNYGLATCDSNSCLGHLRSMARVNTGNMVVGGYIGYGCGSDPTTGEATYYLCSQPGLADGGPFFSSNTTRIEEYFTDDEWPEACQAGDVGRKWLLEFPSIPSSIPSGGYTFQKTQVRSLYFTVNDCTSAPAFKYPPVSWLSRLATVSASNWFAQSFGAAQGFSHPLQYTVTITPNYLP